VSIREQDTTSCQPIHIGRLDLRMSTQAPDPVIEIVDGDEQDVGMRRF
jgi:hypothetical protein